MLRSSALTALVHLAGFGAGALLYGMLGAMAVHTRAGPVRRLDRLPVATALLGVLWNVGALVFYSTRDLALVPTGTAAAWLVALTVLAFAALGFLPAVAVQAAAQQLPVRTRRVLVGIAYAASTLAAVLQAAAALRTGVVPSQLALVTLTVGYVVVLLALALALRGWAGGRAPFVAAALAAFAVTAVHLGHHTPQESIAAHLLGDHASLPLVLVVLYQDYRVAFADLFLKRALTALGLIAFASTVHLLVLVPLAVPRLAINPADPLGTALLAAGLAATLLLARALRPAVGAFVDGAVLRRPDYGALRRTLAGDVGDAPTAAATLDRVCALLAPALLASHVEWRTVENGADVGAHQPRVRADARGREATVNVPVSDGPGYALYIGGLSAGRRLLSDDRALLEWTALVAARRIDLVRAADERVAQETRAQNALRLATEAELRALRAQLQPHFLFNALTTIGYLVQTAPDRAIQTLYELTGLLRAVLRPTPGELVPFDDELAIVESYLAIERARFEERLRVVIDVDPQARSASVLPLLIQPLAENAVKHGIAPLRRGGEVRIRARVEDADGASWLHVEVSDTGAGADAGALARGRAAGFGLVSVEQRLERRYGAAATFAMQARPGAGATVTLRIPLTSRVADAAVTSPPALTAR